ncbi:CAP domain-containing protein [Planctomicrobium piriforme]|uniref:Uncharacterized conserved protein YkwD, contains CAP (CSP/antigen 5/PR1) domain n=1 Tax=Planctomicrobium piriforme TaxID=1576369 RepID=A0A1I3DLC3_9PLAN|nr:CAP domain-containing protein [Planctomicrobium piriforme]SFH87281.1 Uncharacterized conserved protein YkwD, contains CAP (CSP/antigen 5/PR1) domain [Planctomicrobium piriforme]
MRKIQLQSGRAAGWRWAVVFFAVIASQICVRDLSAETPQATANSAGHETIVVTRESTGDYQPRVKADLEKVNAAITQQTNAFRKEEGKGPVEVSDKLQQTANDFAAYMAKTGRYGHQADDQTPSQRASAHGYDFCSLKENIAMQFNSVGFSTGALSQAFFQVWKNSPPHRANMLSDEVTETAVAVAQSQETGAFFAVQLFARPKSQAIEFDIANRTDGELRYKVGETEFTSPEGIIRRHMLCVPQTLSWQPEGQPVQSLQPQANEHYAVEEVEGKLKLLKVESVQ